jgi:hypothetical protein
MIPARYENIFQKACHRKHVNLKKACNRKHIIFRTAGDRNHNFCQKMGMEITYRVVATKDNSISLFGCKTLFPRFIFALVFVLRQGAINQNGESHYQYDQDEHKRQCSHNHALENDDKRATREV